MCKSSSQVALEALCLCKKHHIKLHNTMIRLKKTQPLAKVAALDSLLNGLCSEENKKQRLSLPYVAYCILFVISSKCIDASGE